MYVCQHTNGDHADNYDDHFFSSYTLKFSRLWYSFRNVEIFRHQTQNIWSY